MRIIFICKGSSRIGLGHVIRSVSLANEASTKHLVEYIAIGDETIRFILKRLSFPSKLIAEENMLTKLIKGTYDVVIFDLLTLNRKSFNLIKSRTRTMVSLSPIFNYMKDIDILFNRTKYVPDDYKTFDIKIYAGLEYTIIQENCVKVRTPIFKSTLARTELPIALCMGGGDAGNKTLAFLKHLTKCDVPVTFWVLLGEGYKHSYDQLVHTIEAEKNHEVILAKTNQSMWHILNNCAAIILPGGITTYEATFAGIPTINTFVQESQYFLVRELVEKKVMINAGLIHHKNLEGLCDIIKNINNNREKLLRMHINTKNVIDGNGSKRILAMIEEEHNAQ